MRHRYSIVSVQTLLRSLVISACGYNPLCSQIPIQKCATFDRALHFKYIAATKHTVTQPAHATFLSRDHHGLHIPSLLLTQLQGRARELDVRLNSPDPTQHAPPLARLAAMIPRPNDHKNLIRDAIISLAQFGLHLRDADQPITSISLQLLLHDQPDKTLLGQPSPKHATTSNSPFTITGDVEEHTPYSHNQDLHQWFDTHLIHTHRHMEYDTIPPAPLLYDTDHLQATFVHATLIYKQDLQLFLTFTEWRTTIAQHPTQTPTHPLNAPHSSWHTYRPDLAYPYGTCMPPPRQYISTFRQQIHLQPLSHEKTHPLTTTARSISDFELTTILRTYNSPLIVSIDGSFTPPRIPHIYPPNQPQHPTVAKATASVTVTAINNSHPTRPWTDLPTTPLLARVQPLPAAYGTNDVTNNTAELLARIMACELIPADMPAIIIFDSAVVHSQHLALLTTNYTNRHRTRSVYPAISRMLAQRLAATQPSSNHISAPHARVQNNSAIGPLTLHNTITAHIQHIFPHDRHWNPTKHLTTIGHHLFVKIKSHQLRATGAPKYRVNPQPCYALAHSNHWVDKTCELPYAVLPTLQFPLPCSLVRITTPLYIEPMNLYYGLYPVDTDVSEFIASAYQAELILRLSTKPEMGWYARNMSELQSPNRTIGFIGPTRRLITHQATSWTQQLYKDKNARASAQQYHHPNPYTPLRENTVTDPMKICPFCS